MTYTFKSSSSKPLGDQEERREERVKMAKILTHSCKGCKLDVGKLSSTITFIQKEFYTCDGLPVSTSNTGNPTHQFMGSDFYKFV